MGERRTPYDGKPYYCAFCGLGWIEYQACEAVCCELESVEDAMDRRNKKLALPPRARPSPHTDKEK